MKINLLEIILRQNRQTQTHYEMDAFGKANGMSITYAPWHPHPKYRQFKTGSLLSRNEDYPSGLVIVDDQGHPHPW
jgi:hypothetical protein